jgi:hypothetical protein
MMVGVVFILLPVLFTVFCTIYLYANDFSKETMEVIFPAIGAILLSFYLAFKSIYIDAPKSEQFGGPVAILLDSASGELHGVPRQSLGFSLSPDEFRGASIIDKLPLYNAFKTLDLPEKVRQAMQQRGDGEIVKYVVEYALLSWLSESDMVPGATVGRITRLVAAAGGGGGVPTTLVAVKAVDQGMSRNPLLAAKPLELELPQGSSISRIDEKPPIRGDTHTSFNSSGALGRDGL